jgi:benzoyl-CoA-dihydrodiol lyase
MACDEILLIDDGSSAVSLPEVPLLGVLPGTGGLTRLLDKRRVRRDRADVFATLAEGIRGKRATEWGLVDQVAPRSRFADAVKVRSAALAASQPLCREPGIELGPLAPTVSDTAIRYRFVELFIDRAERQATLTIHGPSAPPPQSHADTLAQAQAGQLWALRAFRELDDALLRLRFHQPTVGLVLLHSRGQADWVVAADEALANLGSHHVGREVRLLQARVLRRLDQTAKSLFAIVDPDSCFAGSLLEVLLAADRSYVLEHPQVALRTSVANCGGLPMYDGVQRLAARFVGRPGLADAVTAHRGPIDAATADQLGLCTVLADELDFADTLRLAIEERASLSPDALTGLEQNLRALGGGSEGMEQRIFGRLSAWQNWIFVRPNATGPRGALTGYGQPERPIFDFKRT